MFANASEAISYNAFFVLGNALLTHNAAINAAINALIYKSTLLLVVGVLRFISTLAPIGAVVAFEWSTPLL
jgi:hypothetical protein